MTAGYYEVMMACDNRVPFPTGMAGTDPVATDIHEHAAGHYKSDYTPTGWQGMDNSIERHHKIYHYFSLM